MHGVSQLDRMITHNEFDTFSFMVFTIDIKQTDWNNGKNLLVHLYMHVSVYTYVLYVLTSLYSWKQSLDI